MTEQACSFCRMTMKISEFYIQKTGAPFKVCKVCYIMRQKQRQLKKLGVPLSVTCYTCRMEQPAVFFTEKELFTENPTCKVCRKRVDNIIRERIREKKISLQVKDEPQSKTESAAEQLPTGPTGAVLCVGFCERTTGEKGPQASEG